MHVFQAEDRTVMVGTNWLENLELIQQSDATWFWVHARDHPSAHAVVTHASGRFPRRVLKQACISVKNRSSRLRNKTRLKFDVCKISNLIVTNNEVHFKDSSRVRCITI
jgi:predicted ribosome quality control (RQC) complex YloA/Tae2 family protein